MNDLHGSRHEREERDRRAMRDSRDPHYGERGYRSEDERFAAETGGRRSQNRDNEYRFDERRGQSRFPGGSDFDRGETHMSDDFYNRGSLADFRSRSDPRQQTSFDRAGYDSEREFWEGQGSQQGQRSQPGRFGQRPEYASGGYGAYGPYGRQGGSYSTEFHGQERTGSSGHDWAHVAGRSGGYSANRWPQQYSGSGNYWEHGSGYQPEQRGQQHPGASSDNYWQHGSTYGPAGGRAPGSGFVRNRPPKGYTRSDERLKEDICEQLMHDGYVDAGDVSVEVKDGKVVLEGTVPQRSMKHRIEDIAEQCSGVKDVDNRIRVFRDDSQAGAGGHASGGLAAEGTPRNSK